MRVSLQSLQWFPEDTKFPDAPQPHIAHPGQFSISMLHLLCFVARVFLALFPLMPSTAELEMEGKHGGSAEEQKGRQDQTCCEM